MTSTALTVGLHPSALDYSRHPGLDEETLTARIEAAHVSLREAGFDIMPCQVTADPDDAERMVRERVAAQPVQIAMIGAGVRVAVEHTLLFERLVNVLNEIAPGIVFCFNTSPESTVDALRRAITRES